jgi:hypothetical protein
VLICQSCGNGISGKVFKMLIVSSEEGSKIEKIIEEDVYCENCWKRR